MAQRPLNECRRCGYAWYPRGGDRSRRCPHCGSYETSLVSPPVAPAPGFRETVANATAGCVTVALGLLLLGAWIGSGKKDNGQPPKPGDNKPSATEAKPLAESKPPPPDEPMVEMDVPAYRRDDGIMVPASKVSVPARDADVYVAAGYMTTGGKTVRVSSYTRRDGTVVHAHDRAAPGKGKAGGGGRRK